MSEPNNRSATVGLVILLVILAGVAYARVPSFRGVVDEKAPWFKEKVGHFLVSSETPTSDGASDDGSPAVPALPPPLSLQALAANQALWPKVLVIKAGVDFPAVLDGKKVGTVRAPAGSQVHLVQINDGRLGVEYQGGGAWVAPEITDLKERVQPGGPPTR